MLRQDLLELIAIDLLVNQVQPIRFSRIFGERWFSWRWTEPWGKLPLAIVLITTQASLDKVETGQNIATLHHL